MSRIDAKASRLHMVQLKADKHSCSAIPVFQPALVASPDVAPACRTDAANSAAELPQMSQTTSFATHAFRSSNRDPNQMEDGLGCSLESVVSLQPASPFTTNSAPLFSLPIGRLLYEETEPDTNRPRESAFRHDVPNPDPLHTRPVRNITSGLVTC